MSAKSKLEIAFARQMSLANIPAWETELFDVGPSLSVRDHRNDTHVYAEPFRNKRKPQPHAAEPPNLSDLKFRQLGILMPLPAKARIATLAHLVSRVVLVCAKKQVRRIKARRVVASVANTHAARDFTGDYLPRNPMGLSPFPSKTEHPITISVSVSFPVPAIAGLVDILGNTLGQILKIVARHASLLSGLVVFRAGSALQRCPGSICFTEARP